MANHDDEGPSSTMALAVASNSPEAALGTGGGGSARAVGLARHFALGCSEALYCGRVLKSPG